MRKLTDSQKRQVCQLLADMVHIDSAVTSTEQADRDRTEERMARFVTDHLGRMGMAVQWQEVSPGRPNVIGHWPRQQGDRRVMLEAHLDTVTVQGMTVDPFAAEIRDGKMFGRGTCDTKGGMAAFLTALEIAYVEGRLPADKLYFVATMSEETGCHGATALMKHGFRTDAAIVGEPTRCQLVTCHKSPLWIEIATHGRACHASTPHCGENAIDTMARVVQVVHGSWTEHLRRHVHPLLGCSTSVVTQIAGGSKINIVPAQCRAHIDSRLIPGYPVEAYMGDLLRMLADHLGGDDEVAIVSSDKHPSLDTPADVPLVARLLALCRQANGQASPQGVNYFADTGPFSEAGITSVLLGPGDIAQAHTADEFIELDQLYQATEIVLSLLTENAGRSIVTQTDRSQP